MSDLRNGLQKILNELDGLVVRARKLKNQNLADIAASAHGKIKQLSEHPDLELADDRKDQAHPGNPVYVAPATRDEAIARMHADGDADPEGTARTNWPHLFDAAPKPDPFQQQPDTEPQVPFPQQQPPIDTVVSDGIQH
jgi:hypothetical protein